jgi:hypothetical protein
MVAYFDIENLLSFLQQPKNDFMQDCLKLVKKQLDLTFNFKKEELKSSEVGLQFLKFLTDGQGEKKIKFCEEKFPSRKIKSNSHKDFNTNELLSIYFINDENIDSLINKDELLVAKIGDELSLFKQLFLNNDDYKFERKLRIGSDFKSWEDLYQFESPLTDLIIVDNFILGDKSLFECNLKGLINNSLKSGIRKKINIVIFYKPDADGISFVDLKNDLQTIVKEKCTESPNITIIKHYAEHDRTILKNFIRIYSGDSFNYFLSSGKKTTKGKEIHFSSIADKENYNLYIELIKDLQKIIDNSNETSIIGDKKSRFLNFN